MAIIRKIRSDSPFFGVLKKGDDLREINGNAVKDFVDYMSFSAEISGWILRTILWTIKRFVIISAFFVL